MKILSITVALALLLSTSASALTAIPLGALSKNEIVNNLENKLNDSVYRLGNLSNSLSSSTVSNNSLQGDTYSDPVITSSRTPILYGLIPSYCDDVGIIIFTDLADFDLGTGLYVFTSADSVWVEGGYPSNYRLWSLDLASVGLNLVNGKYNVFVSSPCGLSYSDPSYADIFYDNISIIPPACTASCTPVHRFYNTQNGAHFYTSSEKEKRTVLDMSQYKYEGIVNFSKSSQESGMIPVHRFYHKTNGTHFYTSNQSEATTVNNLYFNTYRYEGVAYYAYSSPVAGSIPVHRFYKFQQGVHFFTSNQSEASYVNSSLGSTYRYEGVSYYNILNI